MPFPRRLSLLAATNDYSQKPRPALRLVNPVLNQAGGCDIVVLLADLMRGAQEPCQFPVVGAKLCKHVFRTHRLLVVILQPLIPGDIVDGMARGSVDLSRSFWGVV